MMKKLLIALAATGLILPGVASAHTTRAELRHDHKVIHKEKRELARAAYHHNGAKVREERRELASAHKELREDRRDWKRTHRH
jgi:Ni/Co efflux regulator RcnB